MKSIATTLGFLGLFHAVLASADQSTEYTSLAAWTASVHQVQTNTFNFLPSDQTDRNFYPSQIVGPGTFTAQSDGPANGYLFNDNFYGKGVQYIADSPQAGDGIGTPGLKVTFAPSADITALSFDVGTYREPSAVDISVNGSALSPVVLSSQFPTTFLGVTDRSGPITSITFTATTAGELDLIKAFSTAHAAVVAPEIDTDSTAAALALLLGGLVVLTTRPVPRRVNP